MEIVQEIMTFLVPFVAGVILGEYVGVFGRMRKLIGR